MRKDIKDAYQKFLKDNWQKQITMIDLFEAGYLAAEKKLQEEKNEQKSSD